MTTPNNTASPHPTIPQKTRDAAAKMAPDVNRVGDAVQVTVRLKSGTLEIDRPAGPNTSAMRLEIHGQPELIGATDAMAAHAAEAFRPAASFLLSALDTLAAVAVRAGKVGTLRPVEDREVAVQTDKTLMFVVAREAASSVYLDIAAGVDPMVASVVDMARSLGRSSVDILHLCRDMGLLPAQPKP